MTPWLEIFSILEDPGSVPTAELGGSQLPVTPVPGDPGFQWHLYSYGAHKPV